MMKTTLLIGGMLMSTITFAQFSKGDHLVSGSFGLNSSAYKATTGSPVDRSKGSGILLSIAGSTFSSNLVRNTVSFYVSHNVSKTNLNNPSNAYVSTGLNYGLAFSRAKLLPLAKSLYLNFPFNLSTGFTSSSVEQSGATIENRSKGFTVSAGVSAGLLYQLNKRWVLTLSLPDLASMGYSTTKYDGYVNGVLQNPSFRSNSFNLTSGIGARALGDLSVGFGYIIPRKK